MIKYSVLMSVYKNEIPSYFKQAIESILNQTLPCDDFVIVKDGELTNELNSVLNQYAELHGDIINVVGYKNNKGLGFALDYGLSFCKHEIVIRADSDDISIEYRAEKQIDSFIKSGADASSTTILLFEESIDNTFGARKLPTDYKKIVKFAKSRSPLNHPSTIFKKSKVLESGSYTTLLYKEDYYLWYRMLKHNCILSNTDEPLVYMRINSSTFFKRKNKDGYKNLKWLYGLMRKDRFIGPFKYFKNIVILDLRYHLPNKLSAFFTKLFWRK